MSSNWDRNLFEYLPDNDCSTLYSYMVILKTLRSNNISGTTALHENVIKLFLNKKRLMEFK